MASAGKQSSLSFAPKAKKPTRKTYMREEIQNYFWRHTHQKERLGTRLGGVRIGGALMMYLYNNDYCILARFVIPLAFTDVTVDIGEQFLNRSIAHSTNVVDTLAAFGLAYVFVKFFVGVLQEVQHVGVVLVHDRPGFIKILVCIVIMAISVVILLIITAKTPIGKWLIEDLHGVSEAVTRLTQNALLYLSLYPLMDCVSWYHGGVLLQFRHSTLVGVASFADIVVQIFSLAVLLHTPLICIQPIAVPILAAYCGVLTRLAITLAGFYRLVYPKLSKATVSKMTVWKLTSFVSPLMFVLGIQKITRPVINLLVARFSPSKCDAATALAVLTACYPLGRLAYGWINQLRPVSPTFQKKSLREDRPLISGKKIAFFVIGSLCVSTMISVILFWIPGVSVAVMEHAIGLPHDLALLCVDPLRVFAFFCFTVAVRSSLTGWLTLHHQTKLVTPSGFIRLVTVIVIFFSLHQLRVGGALLGTLALFSGFFSEMVVVATVAPIYAYWMKWKSNQRHDSMDIGPNLNNDKLDNDIELDHLNVIPET